MGSDVAVDMTDSTADSLPAALEVLRKALEKTTINHSADTMHRREKGTKEVVGKLTAFKKWWVVSTHEETAMVEKRRGKHSWQAKIVHFFHAPKVQVFFITLLVLDVMIVFVELFVDAEFPRCDIIVRDATSCCNASDTLTGSHRRLLEEDFFEYGHRFLASASSSASGSASGSSDSGHHGHHAMCEPYTIGLKADCDAHQHEAVHQLHDALYIISVTILSAFALELLLLFAALDRQFFHNLLYLVDALVVSSSLSLEIVLKTTPAGELSHALILARLWRFMRVAHGLVVSSTEAGEVGEGGHEEVGVHGHHDGIQKAMADVLRLMGHGEATPGHDANAATSTSSSTTRVSPNAPGLVVSDMT